MARTTTRRRSERDKPLRRQPVQRRMQIRLTIDSDVCPEIIDMLLPMSRESRRMAALQLLREGLILRRLMRHPAAAAGAALQAGA